MNDSNPEQNPEILLLVRVEVLLERLPALEVVLVHLLAGLLAPLGQRQAKGALEHESLKLNRIKLLLFPASIGGLTNGPSLPSFIPTNSVRRV